ncbi:trophoblast glycoprotein-like [Arapaima gigas]
MVPPRLERFNTAPVASSSAERRRLLLPGSKDSPSASWVDILDSEGESEDQQKKMRLPGPLCIVPVLGQKQPRVAGLCLMLFFQMMLCRSCYACPDVCSCSITTVQCRNKGLSNIPQALPVDVEELFITGNNITYVTNESFPIVLHRLTKLHLNTNNIKHIGPGTFANLQSLEFLDLSNNKLLTFIVGTFSFPSLRRLNLRNNTIISFEDSTMKSPKLEHLDLRDNVLKVLSNSTILNFTQRTDFSVLLVGNSWVCDCNIEDFVAWLRRSDVVHDKQNLSCLFPEKFRYVRMLQVNSSELQCSFSGNMEGVLETSYVFLGMVLALIGLIFLLVLYLNRKGIKRWLYNIRDACRDHMEGYHYRYEINSDPRLANISLNSDA